MTTPPAQVRKALLFVGLTYAASWAFVALYLALAGGWTQPGATVVTIAYMFVPALVAVTVQRGVYREAVAGPLGVRLPPLRWLLVALLVPVGIALATLATATLLPGISYSPDMAGVLDRLQDVLPPAELERARTQLRNLPVHPLAMGIFGGMLAGLTVNAVAAFGEELGWRGLLLRALEPLGFWKVSGIIGVVWGFWHAPIILLGHNYPQHPVPGVFMMVLFTLLLSPLFTLVTLRSRSVLTPAVLHGTLNGTGGVAVAFVRGGSDLTVGITGLAGLLVLAGVNVGVWAYVRRPATESPAPPTT